MPFKIIPVPIGGIKFDEDIEVEEGEDGLDHKEPFVVEAPTMNLCPATFPDQIYDPVGPTVISSR